ncbi:MAG TPA: GrlR family regulatory protein [Bradyrhizobium sp.]|nr:GrlR family regulatory protein [Bradyrhizobium sp.]
MLHGLYKVEMHTVHGSRRGVLYVYDGKMMGGNSAFAFIGTYQDADGDVSVDISTLRHNEDPKFQPLLKTDKITLALKGKQRGEQYFFEGGTPQLPGVAFNSVMTPISEEAAPSAPSVEKGGIGNGLYSIHIRMLDGIDGGNTGVMVLHDGRIHGGDAFFDYIGSYSSANGRWKGELVNHEHTPNQGERPVFGGYEVGIGFSGTYTDEGAVAEATALAGKRSIRFSAVLKKLAEA